MDYYNIIKDNGGDLIWSVINEYERTDLINTINELVNINSDALEEDITLENPEDQWRRFGTASTTITVSELQDLLLESEIVSSEIYTYVNDIQKFFTNDEFFNILTAEYSLGTLIEYYTDEQ